MENSPDFAALKELAALDRRRRDLVAERTALPAEIAARDAALAAKKDEAAATRKRLEEAQKDRRRLESEIADLTQLVAKYRGQLDSVKTNKEYQSLQHEIEETTKRIAATEDRLLDVMDEVERNQRLEQTRREELAAAEREVAAANDGARARLADVDLQLLEVEEKRERWEPQLSPRVRSEYARAFERYHGEAFAVAEEGHCGGCFVNVPAQALSEIRAGGRLYRCESCGRFIIFVSEDWRP